MYRIILRKKNTSIIRQGIYPYKNKKDAELAMEIVSIFLPYNIIISIQPF